jgi:hypothetical protein
LVTLLCFCPGLLLAAAQEQQVMDNGGNIGLRGVVIPLGYQKGQINALVQVIADGSPLPGATWELKIEPLMGVKSKKEISGNIAVAEAGVPAVFEAQMDFIPGHFELRLHASETTAGQTGYAMLHGVLPDPNRSLITVGPIATVQPVEAAFMRDGSARGQGALGRTADEPVSAGLPTAMICLICRWKGRLEQVRVERELSGSSSMAFDPIQLELGDERCVQVRDLIQPGIMTDGLFRYEVRVFDRQEQRATGHRVFDAITQ